MGFKRIRRNACTGQINYRTTGDSGPRPKKTIMVKSITTIICGFLVLLSVSSCRKEQEEPCPENGRVTFTVAQTRATQEGTFEKGNSIGVFAIEPKTGVYWATNNKYTYDGRAFKPATEEDNIIVTVGTDLDFYVYYPFKEGQTDITAISHSIGDQQEKSGWLSADFLTASYTDVIQDYTIPLHFEHRLSTVEVRVEGSDRVDGARMENVKYGSRFNLLTGKTVTDETRGSYAMYRYSSGNLTTVFRMTIPAQTLTTTSNYITLTGTPDMKLRGTSDMTTEPGRIHNYRIDYKIRITVLDYPQGGSTTGAGLYDMGSTCTVTASVNGGYEFAGWYEDGRIVSNDTRYSFEVLSDRTLEPRYRNYGGWSVTLTANPSVIGWQGGRSSLVAGASRGVFVNGVAENTQTAVPSLSGGAEGFLLSGNTVTVSENLSGSSRSCVFTASHGGSSATATITQEGSPVSYYFSYADGGTSHSERVESSSGSFILDITSYKKSKYSINSLVYWVTYVHNVVYSFYRSMIYCYINSTQRCAGSIVIDIIPTNGADKRKFFPFAPYFPVTNVIKRYFYPYFPAIIGIKGYSFPYFPYLSGIMKIKTALYFLFSRLDWHKTVVFPCLGEIYEGIRSLSWEIPVT